MSLSLFLIALLLQGARVVQAACRVNSDFETVISGYIDAHRILSVVFDMSEVTQDIVVGG